MNAHESIRNPFTTFLTVAGALGLAAGALLAILAFSEANNYASTMSTDGLAAMFAWSDFLLLVGVVALIGAAVLAGVRWLLSAPATQIAPNRGQTDHTAADGL